MRIDDVIKSLTELKKNGETDIIIGWYERAYFEEVASDNGATLTADTWSNLCESCDDDLNWSDIADQVTDIILEDVADKEDE
jgi:hypothetical protein